MSKAKNGNGLCAMIKKVGKEKKISYFTKYIRTHKNLIGKKSTRETGSPWMCERFKIRNEQLRSFYFDGYENLTQNEKKLFADILLEQHHSLIIRNEQLSLISNLATAVFLSAAFILVKMDTGNDLSNLIIIILVFIITYTIGSTAIKSARDKHNLYIQNFELELITHFLTENGILFCTQDADTFLKKKTK